MKKIELLAPAGNMESLIAAINAGADAVYLSGKKYGARAYAANFSDDELIEAINYAITSGVKGIFTAHGDSLNSIKKSPILNDLLELNIIEKVLILNKFDRNKIDVKIV